MSRKFDWDRILDTIMGINIWSLFVLFGYFIGSLLWG